LSLITKYISIKFAWKKYKTDEVSMSVHIRWQIFHSRFLWPAITSKFRIDVNLTAHI